MENASKALIIAGSVLIAIVLVSIGVAIIASQQNAIKESERTGDILAVQTYNQTFEKYIGKKRGSVIISLLTDIKTNNKKGDNTTITVEYNSIEQTDIGGLQTKINTNKDYIVTIDDDCYDINGYVIKIKLKDVN